MLQPLVSVYMTVRNGSRWVRYAVESIRAQTFKEWELVIVDDGSTDNTLEILGNYAKHDTRIKVISTQAVGRGPALNKALAHCRAKFVANLDADDLAHPKRLEIQYGIARSHPQVALLVSTFIIITEKNNPEWPDVENKSANIRDVTKMLAYYNPINHSSVFAQREAFLAVSGYDQNLRGQLDYDLWVRLAAAGYRLGQVDLPLAAKRWHDAQWFETKAHLAYVVDSVRIQAKAIRVLRPGSHAWLYWLGRFGWAMVPRRMRFLVKGYVLKCL